MSDAPRPEPHSEPETEVIPAVRSGEGIARTREIPVVDDDTTVVPPPEPPAAAAPAAPAPAPAPVPASVPAPVPPPVPAPVADPGPVRGGRWATAAVALAVVLVVAVVAGAVLLRGRGGGDTAATGKPAATSTAPVSATVSSVDPSGGSGFRRDGASTWRTQTYTSADFGNLKDGVGLLLDLGRPIALDAVTVDVVGGPVAVELRAGDSPSSSGSGYSVVTSDGSASGPTRLAVKDGARHRYWLVWVTRLAAQDGGFRAVLRSPQALAAGS